MMDLSKVSTQGLVCEEGFVAALLCAGERPLVVVHPEMPFEPRLLDEALGAVLTFERLFKLQL